MLAVLYSVLSEGLIFFMLHIIILDIKGISAYHFQLIHAEKSEKGWCEFIRNQAFSLFWQRLRKQPHG